MKNKIINGLIIFWVLILTVYAGFTGYNNFFRNRSVDIPVAKSNYKISNLDMNLQVINERNYTLSEVLGKDENKLLIVTTPGCQPCEDLLNYASEVNGKNSLKLKPLLLIVGTQDLVETVSSTKYKEFEHYIISSEQFNKQFKGASTPLIIVINWKGKVLYSWMGWSSSNDFKKAIYKHLNSFMQ